MLFEYGQHAIGGGMRIGRLLRKLLRKKEKVATHDFYSGAMRKDGGRMVEGVLSPESYYKQMSLDINNINREIDSFRSRLSTQDVLLNKILEMNVEMQRWAQMRVRRRNARTIRRKK